MTREREAHFSAGVRISRRTTIFKSIYADGELVQNATCKDYLQVQMEGSRQINRAIRHGEVEIDHLNRIISMWLDYAEDQTKRRQQIFLKTGIRNWSSFLILRRCGRYFLRFSFYNPHLQSCYFE